jgi:hypothetical protein
MTCTLEITAKDIEVARVNNTMPATVAFERQYYFKSVRTNEVCAVCERRDGTWVKIKFPFRMWDWVRTFVEGKTPEPTMLSWPGTYSGTEEIFRDPMAKGFDHRYAEKMSVQVVEAV